MSRAPWGRRAGLVVGALLLVGFAACGDDDGEPGADAAVSTDGQVADGAVSPDASPTDASVTPDAGPNADGGWYEPGVTSTWQWQLTGTLNTSYDVAVYDIDLFDTLEATIASLQAQGRAVICYFSAGSSENWRPDFDQFQSTDMGNNLDGWPGERWLDVRSTNVRSIMADRLDLASQKGCDGVEPDNVDGYDNNSGFDFSAQDQLAYNRWLANQAHARGLAVGLKNDLDQVAALVGSFDFSVNEECHDYTECDLLQPFLDAGKPVFNAEYADNLSAAQSRATTLCPTALSENLRTLILPWDLDDSFRVSCD